MEVLFGDNQGCIYFSCVALIAAHFFNLKQKGVRKITIQKVLNYNYGGIIMKKVVILLIALAVVVTPFGALANKLSNEQLSELAQLEILVGDDTGNLRLSDNITIAEASKIVTSAMGVKNDYTHICSKSEHIFVPADHWAHYYILTAATIGYIPQEFQSEFYPNAEINGKTALIMVMKLAGYNLPFEEISDYAKKYSLIDNHFDFNKSVTREEFATLLEKVFDIPARILESYDAKLGAQYIIADGTYGKPYHTYRLHYINNWLASIADNN